MIVYFHTKYKHVSLFLAFHDDFNNIEDIHIIAYSLTLLIAHYGVILRFNITKYI